MTASALDTQSDSALDATDQAPAVGSDRRFGAGLVVGGALGLLAAFVLAVEKYRLLTDAGYVPTCSINPVLSCGSVMDSPQAEAFGFPNPLLGLIGFTAVLVAGVVLAGGARLPPWFWAGLQAGVSAGVLFVHWLIEASLYRYAPTAWSCGSSSSPCSPPSPPATSAPSPTGSPRRPQPRSRCWRGGSRS
jgi:uncharacterized membrane protein